MAERIGSLVIGHLENAFIHGQDHDLSGLVGFVFYRERLTGARLRGNINGNFSDPVLFADRKRSDAIAQRAHVNLFGISGANKGNIHIAIALQSGRQLYFFDKGVVLALEPLAGVYFIPLYGDQSRAAVWRFDIDLDLLARLVIGLVQPDIQFRRSIQ